MLSKNAGTDGASCPPLNSWIRVWGGPSWPPLFAYGKFRYVECRPASILKVGCVRCTGGEPRRQHGTTLPIERNDVIAVRQRWDDAFLSNRQPARDHSKAHRTLESFAASKRHGEARVEGITRTRRIHRPYLNRRNTTGRRVGDDKRTVLSQRHYDLFYATANQLSRH